MKLNELRRIRKLYEKGKCLYLIVSGHGEIDISDLLFITEPYELDIVQHLFDASADYGIYDKDGGDYHNVENITALKYSREQIENAQDSKEPKNDNNHIGLELELVSKKNLDEMAELLIDAKVEQWVEIKEDCSINTKDNEYAIELAICAEETKIFQIVKKILKTIKPHCRVNNSCGMHVHLDMRNRNSLDCTRRLTQSEGLLYSIYPKRLTNHFCKPTWVAPPSDWNRYCGINTNALSEHSTIEIRIAEGTLNYYDISNWILLLLKIINNKAVTNNTLPSFKKELKLGATFNKYLKSKIKKKDTGIQELIRLDKISL